LGGKAESRFPDPTNPSLALRELLA
jgi:hypothetical protein